MLELPGTGAVTVAPPTVPHVEMALPVIGSTVVVPVVGPQGVRGPAGDETGLSYRHSQVSTANTWTITHNMGFFPSGVIVHNSAGRITEFDNIAWPDENTVVITFYPGRALSGYAVLS